MLTSLALALLPAPVQGFTDLGSVYTVDPLQPNGADFVDLQVAIDTVPEHSTLLIQQGTYIKGAFLVDGKSLNFVGDPTSTSTFAPSAHLEIRNLAREQTVRMEGLSNGKAPYASSVFAEDCEGLIWIEDCKLAGGFFTPALSGLYASRCDNLVIVDSTIRTGSSYFGGVSAGAIVDDSTQVAFHGSDLRGSSSVSETIGYCISATAGLRTGALSSSQLYDCRVEGGACSDIPPLLSAAIKNTGGGAELRMRNCELVPGSLLGQAAPPYEQFSPSLVGEQDAAPRQIETASKAFGGSSLDVVISGVAGDRTFLFAAPQARVEFAPLRFSHLALVDPWLVAGPLVLPNTGLASVDVATPDLPPGQALPIYLQAYHVPQAPENGPFAMLGSPDSTTLLR